MEKLAFKIISDEVSIDYFLEKFQYHVGVKLPTNYAIQNKVVGVFLHEKLVGGYMLVTEPGFRGLLFVPDKIKNQYFQQVQNNFDIMEVNGLWLSPALKTPKLQLQVWFRLVRDIFSCKKKHVLLLRNSKNKSMERLLSMVNPITLYSGPPSLHVGQNTHPSIHVSYATRWRIVLNFYKYILELQSRNRRAQFALRSQQVVGNLDI